MANELILIVDDEKEICDLIEIYLKNEGFEVLKAANGIDSVNILKSNNVHLIVLDLMMPKMDGIQACMRIRKEKNMPIIMLSAKSQDNDKILGLGVGADDYITKPFNPLELVARVKSHLRRYTKLNSNFKPNEDELIFDQLEINTAKRIISIDGKEIKLTKREFDILVFLAKNSGIVLSIEKIYESVWKEDFFEGENTVMVHIRKIREKIEENPRKPRFIKTVWGVGYKWMEN